MRAGCIVMRGRAAPGTPENRVYASYAPPARPVPALRHRPVRATPGGGGLMGLALAPDFASSKPVYVYLTTTDESVTQHVRVYRENAAGVGEYLGAVQTGLEPPTESTNRNGGGLAFGVDGCL